jgi:hypothetical protein
MLVSQAGTTPEAGLMWQVTEGLDGISDFQISAGSATII